MEHKKVIANIKIMPSENGKSRIIIEMPIWLKRGEDNKMYANLALLGGIMTCAENEADLDVAINEAVSCFFESAQALGSGFKRELIALGWQIKKSNKLRFKVKRDRDPICYGLPESPAFKEVMQTGTSKSLSLSI